MALTIRTARPGDRDRLYEICLRTGDAGQDATGVHGDPDLLGDVYVGPYLALSPDLAFVLVDDDDVPLGYVLGAADTAAFAAACAEHWWPRQRRRHPLESAPEGSRDAQILALVHRPPPTPAELIADHPAHLHVDLLPAVQGQGQGRRLLEHLFDALRARGVPGVHLGVGAANVRATAFYHHLGFRTLDADAHGALLGLDLRPPTTG